MKLLTSITTLKTGEGTRVAYTYSDVDNTGKIVSQNNKGNFVVVDDDLAAYIAGIEAYVKKCFLTDGGADNA